MAAAKTDNLNVRISPEDHALVRRAAEACGENLTQFVLDAAVSKAQQSLMDQRFLRVSADVFDSVIELVDQPARPHPELVKLFKKNPVWSE